MILIKNFHKLILLLIFTNIFFILYRNFGTENLILVKDNYKIFFIKDFSLYFSLTFLTYLYYSLKVNKNLYIFNYKVSVAYLLILTIAIILLIKSFTINFINIYTLLGLNEHRATLWLVSYQDFGFIKRSFMGSFYKLIFNSNPSYIGIFFISLLFLSLKVVVILNLISKVFKKKRSTLISISTAFFITSPYFIYFYLADLGRFDQFNNLIMLVILFLIPNFYFIKNLIAISILSFIAVLIHESFILLQFPFIFFLIFLESISKYKENFFQIIFAIIFIILISLFSSLLIIFFGFPGSFTQNEMLSIIGEVNSFEIRKDVIKTFYDIPWENFNLIKNITSIPIASEPSANIFLIVEFILINFPFLIINLYLLNKIQKNINYKYFKLNNLLYLVILFPYFISLIITFNDYYRIFASITLMIFLSNIYLIINNNISISEPKGYKYEYFLLLGVFYNLYIIGITSITAYSSSSPSIYLYLMNNFFFKVI